MIADHAFVVFYTIVNGNCKRCQSERSIQSKGSHAEIEPLIVLYSLSLPAISTHRTRGSV